MVNQTVFLVSRHIEFIACHAEFVACHATSNFEESRQDDSLFFLKSRHLYLFRSHAITQTARFIFRSHAIGQTAKFEQTHSASKNVGSAMDRQRIRQEFDRLFADTFGGKAGEQRSKDTQAPTGCHHLMRTCKKCRPAPRRYEEPCDFPLARTPPDSPRKRPRAHEELEHGDYSFSDEDDPATGQCAPVSKGPIPRSTSYRARSSPSVCEHGKPKGRCKICGGPAFCRHYRLKWGCRECGGTQICEHDRRRNECVDCGGAGICNHKKRRTRCKMCKRGE